MTTQTRARTYEGETRDETTRLFQEDATEAAQHGWFASSRLWEGTVLSVVYEQRPAGEPPATEAPEPEPVDPLPSEVARAYTGATRPLFGEAEKPDQRPPTPPARRAPRPPSVATMTPDELARVIAKAVTEGNGRDPSSIWPIVRLFGALAAAGLLAWAGFWLLNIQSVSGDTIMEASYQALGVMCLGFALLAGVVAARELG